MSTWPDPAAGDGARHLQAGRARGHIREDVIYLGWQHVPAGPDAGLPPAPPEPGLDDVSPAWLAAQRREHRRLTRSARRTVATAVAILVAAGSAWYAGNLTGDLGPLLTVLAALAAVASGRLVWRGRRELAAQVRAEELRVAAFRDVQRSEYADRQRQYAEQYRYWRERAAAIRRQPHWYPVTVPAATHRVDIAGGTLAGWSALLTMLAAPRLAAGGEVTVVDLTEGGVAADLLAVARRSGIDPLVWVLPADLPQLELGTQLGTDLLADALARTVSAADGATGRAQPGSGLAAGADPAGDAALLGRILHVLAGAPVSPAPTSQTAAPPIAPLIAALRVLGQIGGPADHLRSAALTPAQVATLGSLAGRGAERLVVERAWVMESRLSVLAPLATNLSSRPPSRLKVAWLDRRAAATGNGVIAAYLAVALTALLRQAPPGPRWRQTLCLLGAERLSGDVLDRLCDASEIAGAGLVLAYRTIPAHVRERLGRGDAAVGFMRLGNAEDARVAAEQIGTEHRFVISQLTDTVGASVTDTAGVSYSSSVSSSESVTESDSVTSTGGRSHGRGRSGQGMLAPFADFTGSASTDVSTSTAVSDSGSITAGISAGTSWGRSTSRAVGASGSLAMTAQRSRESLVEQHELQQLPQSALLLSYPTAGGRRVVLADANPAIMTLPTATLAVGPDPASLRPDRPHGAPLRAFRPDIAGTRSESM
ncbi:MAG TPA: hypothetical protein VGI64_06070 [Streptosporangiaceae bacterium]